VTNPAAGLAGALAAAVAYGAASVLQGVAARRTAPGGSLDPRLLLRLARQGPYVAGLGLDLAGFALSVLALRTLPLFAVEAAVASSIGVTALLAAAVLHQVPTRRETAALAGIGAGLLLLAASAAPDDPASLPRAGAWAVLAGAVLLAALAWPAGRRSGERAGVTLGALAGLAFGGVGVAARAVRTPHPLWHGATDPLVLALVAYGLLGTLLYATALQRGRVTTATAALFAAETVGPALVGLTLLGDHARPGLAPLAVAGFAVTLAGCLALTRYATLEPVLAAEVDEQEHRDRDHEAESDPPAGH
jgi:drug/metabolite transporter (DMT)-like permease